MEKFVIKDYSTMKEYFQKIDNPIIAIKVFAFTSMLGIANIAKNFEMIAFLNSKESEILKKKYKVTLLNEIDFNNTDAVQAYKSLEKMCEQNKMDPGRRTVTLIQSKKIVNYINSIKPDPVLLFHEMSPGIQKELKKHNWKYVASDLDVKKKYEDKIEFARVARELNISTPDYIETRFEGLDYESIKTEFGERVVIQDPFSQAGKGTFFINNKKEFDKFVKDHENDTTFNGKLLKVSKYISYKSSPCIAACVTKQGTVVTDLHPQLMDVYEIMSESKGRGNFCGNQWNGQNFSDKVEKEAKEVTKKIGDYLRENEDFTGIFGLDFILEEATEELYLIEINVRLVGNFPVSTWLQDYNKQPLLQGLQIIDSLDRHDYTLDIESLDKEIQKPKYGAHLNIFPKSRHYSKTNGSVNVGIYSVKDGEVKFLREGYQFCDIENDYEYLITGTVPYKNFLYRDNHRILKIVSKVDIVDKQGKLLKDAKTLVDYVYNQLDLEEIVNI